jgi:Holliday junction DNA helicase RuvA
MIGSLRASVIERNSDGTVLVETAGVGYIVHVTPRTLAELEPTSAVFMHVHHHIREDAQTLFGFLDKDERVTFQTLIATHGIGPSMAMAILAHSLWFQVLERKLPSACWLSCETNCSFRCSIH